MSRISPRHSGPIPWRKAAWTSALLVVLVLLFYGVPALTSRIPESNTSNHPPIQVATVPATATVSTCYQLVPRISVDLGSVDLNSTPVPGSGADATMDPLPQYGYCAIAFKNSPWQHTVTSQLPPGSVACVFYEQTPDLAVSNRVVAVYSVGDSFTIDVVKGTYADGKPFTATPRAVILYIAVSQSLQPKELPAELSQLKPQVLQGYSEVVPAAMSPIFGIPAIYTTVEQALQVPGWK